jgi:ribosomal protein S18 acetylase RimI-like enzyme
MGITLGRLQEEQFDDAAALIHASTNAWYLKNTGRTAFGCEPSGCRLFPDTYDALDAGQCITATDDATGKLIGTCYLHPRETHIGVGIVNTAPDVATAGVASMMLREACTIADAQDLPLRLVSSASNMDSYSLYHRQGFVARQVFQDMLLNVPEDPTSLSDGIDTSSIRFASITDVPAIAALERALTGSYRPRDWEHFLKTDHFNVLVDVAADGTLLGALNVTNHTANCTLGPAHSSSEASICRLLAAALPLVAGRTALVLVSPAATEVTSLLYGWKARNADIHLLQVRGTYTVPTGVQLMTFLPESA